MTANGLARSPEAQKFIARDLAGDIGALLASRAGLINRHDDGSESSEVIGPGDIAVLVRTNRHANIVRDALVETGVPAVVAGGSERLRIGTGNRVVAAARSDRAADLANSRCYGSPHLFDRVGTRPESRLPPMPTGRKLHFRLARWSEVLRSRGISALSELVSASGLPRRVLCRPAGERFLTDVLHVGRLLHRASVEDNLGTAAMIAWLRRRITEAADDRNDEERSLRLESDAEAVQVLTIHRSKGLEFPVVYCPYMWDGYRKEDAVPIPIFHDPDDGYHLTVDVGGATVGFSEHLKLQGNEQDGEDLRLLYVALTRACHQAVIWWAGATASGKSPLGRLLFARGPDGVVLPGGSKAPSDAEVRARFEELSQATGGSIGVEDASGYTSSTWEPRSPIHPSSRPHCSTAPSTISGAGRPTRGSPPMPTSHGSAANTTKRWSRTNRNRRQTENWYQAVECQVRAAKSGVAQVGRTAAVCDARRRRGRLVHSRSSRRDGLRRCRTCVSRFEKLSVPPPRDGRTHLGDRDLLVSGLRRGDRYSARPDRRRGEVARHIPQGSPGRAFLRTSVGRWGQSERGDIDARRRSSPQAEPSCGRPPPWVCRTALGPGARQGVRGFLTGSIDLVFRFAGNRLAIVDYKTNRLAPRGVQLSAWHYRSEAMEAEMHHAHYPLQAMLYTVALHRYMRWRDPGYDAERDFAGVLYLFVRGMSSADFPLDGSNPCGVWSWRPPVAADRSLSDLFDQGAESDGRRRRESSNGKRTGRWSTLHASTTDQCISFRTPLACCGPSTKSGCSSQPMSMSHGISAVSVKTDDDAVLLAVALAVRAPRLGHTCVDLDTIRRTADTDVDTPVDLDALDWPDEADWIERLRTSALVGEGCPLRLEGSILYLDRYWGDEMQVAADLLAAAGDLAAGVDHGVLADGVERMLRGETDPLQRLAAASAVLRRFTVVAGGPGRVRRPRSQESSLYSTNSGRARAAGVPLVALAAPTGKAAARLEQSVHEEIAALDADEATEGASERPRRDDAAPAPRVRSRTTGPGSGITA